MNARAPRAPREERRGVGLCGRILGLLQVLGVLRFGDLFCAPQTWEVGFSSGIVGLDFFIFCRRGGCAIGRAGWGELCCSPLAVGVILMSRGGAFHTTNGGIYDGGSG